MEDGVPEGWKLIKLGDSLLKIIDGDRGKNYPKKNDFYDSGYCLFLNTKNVTARGFEFLELNFITEEKDKILRKGKLKRNDIVLTTRGTVGNVAYYNEKVPFENIRINSGMLIIRPDGINLDFNYQLFKYLRRKFLEFTSGSAQPQMPIRDLKQINILLPSLPEQHAIASVLSSLDDKIDLLHHQNKTLEAIAETLFRQWFVEEAKEEWEEYKIGDKLDILLGGTPSTKKPEYWNGDIFWINSGEINKFRILEPTKHITQLGLDNSSTKVLPKSTTVLAITGATLGQVSRLEIDACANQSVIGIIDNDEFSNEYIYLWIKFFIKDIISNQTGGAQQHINRNNVRNTIIIKPDKVTYNKFMNFVKPIFSKISTNSFQIRTLEKLRDTLLPKLMSGQVRVEYETEARGSVEDLISQHIEGSMNPFKEAIFFSGIVGVMSNEDFYPDRFRVIKAGYLAKRYMGVDVLDRYAKMEAGPYDSAIRYEGPENIAKNKGYIEPVGNTQFKKGERFIDIEKYLEKYGYKPAIKWLAQLKYVKSPELELLATVDYTVLDLMRQGRNVSVKNIISYIKADKEWKKKLEEKADVFNSKSISGALKTLAGMFPETYRQMVEL